MCYEKLLIACHSIDLTQLNQEHATKAEKPIHLKGTHALFS